MSNFAIIFDKAKEKRKMKRFIKNILMLLSFIIAVMIIPLQAYAAESGVVNTGDGRIYLAVGVLIAAIIVAVIMVLLKKK